MLARKALVENINYVRSEIKKQSSTAIPENTNKKRNSLMFKQFLTKLYQLLHFEENIEFASASERAVWGLVVDGPSLHFMLQPGNGSLFIELTQYCNSVLVCRATPAQKAAVVTCVKHKLNRLTLAIGRSIATFFLYFTFFFSNFVYQVMVLMMWPCCRLPTSESESQERRAHKR